MNLEEEFIKSLSKNQLQDLIINIVEQLKIENDILRRKIKMLEELQDLKEEKR